MAETIGLLSKIKRAYPNFTLITNKDGQGRVVSSPTAEIWHERLSLNGITLNEALESLNTHIDNVRFEPTIADILKPKKEMSVYDVQRIEREQEVLALKEYHEKNVVGPPPNHVLEKLQKVFNKTRVPAFIEYAAGGEEDE
ncbi:hypothetical protein [Paenibacillus amylolyticus]|uniref:hypothetical protein n=1 Tax=Paenibacillus amylolyticus TaxID=1451 RepID=UPI003D972613